MAGFFNRILTRFKKDQIDWDELEEALISGDLGVRLSTRILDALRSQSKPVTAEDVVAVCRAEILKVFPTDYPSLETFADRPRVVLVAGVNGTGKTTSVAKLGHFLQGYGCSVMLAAADTFRAAAIEQLEIWADRIGAPIVKGAYQSDPAAVCFNAYDAALRQGIQFLLCDTAGRLHTRHNLMQELSKIQRTLAKKDPGAPHDILLVVDATTGGNALSQAKEFQTALSRIDGLIVTKLDGSGKGGVAVAITEQLGIRPWFIGSGEKIDQFEIFDPQRFVAEIL